MDQFTGFNVSDLDKARLKGEDVGVVQRKCLRCSFPLNLPILSCSPSITIDEETKVRVVEQELAIQSLDVDWLYVLFARHKVERGIGLVEERLSLCGFK